VSRTEWTSAAGHSNVRVVTTPSDADQPGNLPVYPTGSSADEPPTRAKRPVPVTISFWILIFSAVLDILSGVVTLATYQDAVNAALKTTPPSGTSMAQWESYIHTVLNISLALDLVFGAMYVLFAFMIRAGRNWARLTATGVVILFGLLTIFTGASDILSLVSILVEVIAIGLLYAPSSRDYFASAKAANQLR
jgi:hypothetical protein